MTKEMTSKVAIVTGANKGIGFAIVRGLCKRFDGVVYLTARDIARGQKAVDDLEKEGLKPRFHQLDVTDKQSLKVFRYYLKNNYNGIDVLVNNAAIAFRDTATEPVTVQAEQTLRINYFGVVQVCDVLFPLLKPGARVINVSSSSGHLTNLPSEDLRKKFQDSNLTIPALNAMMQRYLDETKKGTQAAEWGKSSYSVAKVGVTALTKIQQKNLADKDIKVNAVNPGYAVTGMTNPKAPMTVDEAAESPLYLALDAPDTVKGQYVWYTKENVSWSEKGTLDFLYYPSE